MRARLFCKVGEFRGASFDIQDEARIGKAGDNTVRLESPVISSRHARIYYDVEAGRYVLEDLGSRNGTQLDGAAVTEKEPLGSLHVVTFAGTHDFFFQIVPEPVGASNAPAPSAPKTEAESMETIPESAPSVKPPDPMATVLETPGATRADKREKLVAGPASVIALEWIRPDGSKRTAPLKPGGSVVGRSPKCEICIDDASISREHAVLSLESGGVRVRDLGGMNGTTVGGKKLVGEIVVAPETDIVFGMVAARLVRRAANATEAAP